MDECEWLERATAQRSKRWAMLFSMSPRRSWRSMLTSFGCEQIVQVRAMQCDSKRAPGRSLKTYSGTGQPGATAKMAQYRGDNVELSGCSRQALSGLAFAPRAPRAVMAVAPLVAFR